MREGLEMTTHEKSQQVAEALARDLQKHSTDPNEVASVLATLRDEPDGERFFRFLDTVIEHGDAVVRSRRTLDYYRSIRDVCRKHLSPYQNDPKTMAQILGWAVRLMRYYRVEDRLEQPPPRVTAKPKIAKRKEEVGRQSGTVKWFNPSRNYGFIAPDDGGDDVFVHISSVEGKQPLRDGQRVTFTVKHEEKGPAAYEVRLA